MSQSYTAADWKQPFRGLLTPLDFDAHFHVDRDGVCRSAAPLPLMLAESGQATGEHLRRRKNTGSVLGLLHFLHISPSTAAAVPCKANLAYAALIRLINH